MPTAAATPTNGKGPEKPPRAITQQLSYSGTPRGRDGITSPDDYVAKLADLQSRMEIFEEMGASDDAIGIALEQRTLEVLAANWQLSTADESDQGKAIVEFCEDNLYPHLEQLLRWLAAEPPQYGFAAIEPVFAWSDAPFTSSIARGEIARPTRTPGERRLYLRRCAHIRQTAVTAFLIDENGELLALNQQVFDGSKFRNVDIPAEKLLLRTYRRKGDDYSGVPAIRHLYKAFHFKQQIERLTVLYFDKYSVGVPVIIAPPQGFTPAERSAALQAAMNWRSGAEPAIVLPGGDVKIVVGEGTIAAAGLEWSRHFNGQSAKALVTQQSELGSTETGSRAVGETFADQLGGASQADCEDIANLLNNLLIVPLVKWNFGPQEIYPTFSPSQRSKDGAADATAVQAFVTAGMIHARPEDEAAVRDSLGLPEVAVETLKQEQADRETKAAEIAKQAAANTPPNAPNDKGNGSQPPKPPLKVAATRTPAPEPVHVRQLAAVDMAPGAPAPAVQGETSYRTREFAMWEQEILRPDLLMRDLDMHATRLASEVRDALAAIDADLERQATALAEQGLDALGTGAKDIVVPERLKDALREVMLSAATRARSYGGDAVRREIIRQLAPGGIGPARMDEPMGWFARGFRRGVSKLRTLAARTERSPFDVHLEAEVDRVVEDEIDRREKSARSSVLTAIAAVRQAAAATVAVLASVVSSTIQKALESLSVGTTEQNVKGVVNVAFGIGRTEEAQAINAAAIAPSSSGASPAVPRTAPTGGGGGNRSGLVDANGEPIELVAKVYSAVMDFGTCDECAKWDGAEFPIDYPEGPDGVQCPNPRCAGGYNRCRCVWIYVTAQEGAASVPAAKGPTPVDRMSVPFTREEVASAVMLAIEPKLAELRQLHAQHAASGTNAPAPAPITLSVTIEAPKPGSTVKKLITPRGEFTITETPTEESP